MQTCLLDPECTLQAGHTRRHSRVTDDGEIEEWGWVDPPPKPVKKSKQGEWRAKAATIRAGTAVEETIGPPRPEEAFRRNDDPPQSHEAIEHYEAFRETAKGRCLALLRTNLGVWLDAKDFTMESVGGFAGTRRVRELRDEGHPIEIRRKPGTTTVWQYRLVTRSSEPGPV